jgi:hypothetical protein
VYAFRQSLRVTAAITLSVLTVRPGAFTQQQTNSRANWPCGARIDPSYFHGAEGTGGQLLLLAPSEIATSADLPIAFDRHPETVFRLGGTIQSRRARLPCSDRRLRRQRDVFDLDAVSAS